MVRVLLGFAISLTRRRSVIVISVPRRQQLRQTRRLWLVKSTPAGKLRQHLCRGTCHDFLLLSNPNTNLAVSDTILHVPRTDARKSLRLKIRHLVPRMSHIRTLRPQTPISRGEDPRRAEHIYKVRSFRRASQYGTSRVLETDAYHLYREVTAQRYRVSLKR